MKKNFVKVVFFGALALSTVTYVGCKDYDDDVQNLQEQIDKINAKEPGVSTEAMTSAIQSAVASLKTQLETAISGKADNASVQALQKKVNELVAALEGKADAEKINDLVAALEGKADAEKVNELVAALEGKADAGKIAELVGQINELSKEVNNVKGSLDDTKAELETKIANLKEQIAKLEEEVGNIGGDETPGDTSLREQLNKLTADLATAQNELATVNKAAEDNAAEIIKLTTQIAELDILKGQIAALEAAHADFVQTGDLAAYYTKEEIAVVIDTKLASYMTEEQVASYVDEIVKTDVLMKIADINGRMDIFDAGLAEVSQEFATYCEGQAAEYKKVIDRIAVLEDYKAKTLTALEDSVCNQGKDLAQALLDIQGLKDKFAGYATTEALANMDTEVRAYVDEEVKKCTGRLDILEEDLKALRVDVDGLLNMIQSITFVPSSIENSRIVNFTTLYAKSKETDTDYGITLNGATIQKVMFRISPAAAAESFAENYDVTFSADRELTRAVQEDQFEVVGEPEVEGGLVTYSIKSNATKSFAVCMHVSTKEDKVEKLGKTDITSDYFVADVSKQYLVDAYYVLNDGVEENQDIHFDVKDSKAEYKGRVVLSVSDNVEGSELSECELTEYPGFDAEKSLTTTFSVDDDTYFTVNDNAVVMLKAYETPSYLDKSTKVYATVTAEGFYISGQELHIGEVTVTKETKKATIDYGNIDATWSNGEQIVDASKFPLNTIYDNENVRLTLREFQALTGAPVKKEADDKVYFEVSSEVSSKNELTAVIEAQTPKGEYPIEAKFASDGREIIVKATIIVDYPEIANLEVDEHFWGGTPTAGKVGFTPTLDQDDKPTAIILSYDLSDLFANYSVVKAGVDAIDGATLEIDVPDWDKIAGVAYNKETTTLTFDQSAYTGKTNEEKEEDRKDAKVQIVATVSLAGTDEPLQKLTADVNITDISGRWTAGKNAVVLDNKAAVYSLAEGFSWEDMRKKAMWKDGSEVTDEKEFGTKQPLRIYGLTAPSFRFVNAEGKDEDCPYLDVNDQGKLSFTATGKGYNFQTDYTVYVMIDAKSQWGEITGYKGNNMIKVTIPANVK